LPKVQKKEESKQDRRGKVGGCEDGKESDLFAVYLAPVVESGGREKVMARGETRNGDDKRKDEKSNVWPTGAPIRSFCSDPSLHTRQSLQGPYQDDDGDLVRCGASFRHLHARER